MLDTLVLLDELGAGVVEVKSVTHIHLKKYFESQSDLYFECFTPELLSSTLPQTIKVSLFDENITKRAADMTMSIREFLRKKG